jgi:single-strand DNA-binding protein
MATVVIFGKVGRKPEKRSDRAPVEFSVAVDQGWGENKSTNWFVVKVWGKAGEIALEHLDKGMTVCASGEFGLRSYTTQDGVTKQSLEVNNAVVSWSGGAKPAQQPVEDDSVPF